REGIRAAWQFPSPARAYSWHAIYHAFAGHFPRTRIFNSLWPGLASGYENAFDGCILPGLRNDDVKKLIRDSRRGSIRAPLSLLSNLAAFKPDVLFCCGFRLWTLFALFFKFLRGSRVVIYWEGCSAQSIPSSKIKMMLRRLIGRFADAAISNGEDGAAYLVDVISLP